MAKIIGISFNDEDQKLIEDIQQAFAKKHITLTIAGVVRYALKEAAANLRKAK